MEKYKTWTPGPWTPSWTGSMDRVHQNMDFGCMDPLFLLALKLVVIKDYECILRLLIAVCC